MPELRNIAVCVPQGAVLYYPLLSGVSAYLAERSDWSIYLQPLRGGGLAHALRSWEGDGVICALTSERDYRTARELDVPAVNLAGTMESPPIPTVRGNDRAVGELAAEHFSERGFRHLASFGWTQMHYARSREEGFRQRALETGTEVCGRIDAAEVFPHSWSEQLEALSPWLRELPRPCGVFAVFDALGHLLIEACHRTGLNVPEEVAVLGVDNDEAFCSLSNPPMSSVDTGFERRGYEGAALLADLIDGSAPPVAPILVPPEGVVVRRSTDVYATDDSSVRRALRFIAEHDGEEIRVDDVAAAVHMSRRNLERRFRRALQRSVYDEIRRAHLKRARTLLERTEMGMLHVALASGFRSASDLSNSFRRHVGMTPSEYRRRHAR